jgi:hypothetical protein
MPCLSEQIAAIIDPQAWSDEPRASIRAQNDTRYRRRHSMKKARRIVEALGAHFTRLALAGEQEGDDAK